ncbi:MAG: PAS domain S-box protein, partial [Myxococcota bacterium]
MLHPDDQEPWFRLLERSRKPGGLFSCEMRLRRSDNRYIWVRSNAIWLPRGGEKVETLLGFILDVEEVRQAREAVRRSEARFRAFFDHAPIAAFIKDADHRYLYVNDMTASIVGLPLEHILGRTVEELFSPEVAERLADVDRRVLAGQTIETWSGEVSSVDGRQHQMLDIKFPVQDLDTDELLVGGFGLDVTEERQAQARLQSAQRLESLGVLAGGVAHDFNNLLVAILGNAELARTGNEEERENCLTAVVQTARRASELCEQLLAYAGRSVTRKTVLHVPDFIRGTHDLLAISTRELCDVRLQFHDSCPDIEFDPGQLQQIVINLVMNAAQASPTKDSVVTVECDAAHRIEEEGASVVYNWVRAPSPLFRIRVADEGEGLASETVARIFDPFFTTKSDGHGLGLAAVLGIVKANAGAIQVNSAPGHGTSISIYLPSTNQPISTDAPVRPNSEHTAVQGTVLVVDDEASVADVCRLLLERMGLDVIVVSTGQEAIEITAT